MEFPREKLLTTSALRIGYGKAETANLLFKDLELELNKGQLVCFMGPNGAGKSSLIRTLAGLQRPLGGQVILDSSLPFPRQVSVVLTDKPSFTNTTVRELVAYGRYPYLNWRLDMGEDDRKMIDESIRKVNISSLADKNISELSDGQLQMVMIARALAQDTPVILLDEPTAHLDLNNRVVIMKLLRTLAGEMQKAILVATHELDLALQTADLIWLTGSAKDIITGLPEDLVLNGSFDQTFKFKGYDLRSGKVFHEAYRNKSVQLRGEGYHFLWTKNALERTGFTVTQEESDLSVIIEIEETKPRWTLQKNNRLYHVNSIAALIKHI